MPKGQRGCFACGQEPTALAVQVWLSDYIEGAHYAAGGRKQVSVDTMQRSFCAACGQQAFDRATVAIDRTVAVYHGCAWCGRRATCRIQVWMRSHGGRRPGSCDRSQVTVGTATVSFCEDCSHAAYDAALRPLDGEWRHEERVTPAANLAAARRRLRERAATA